MVYREPLRPDELMHFGIKGTKWGVRKRRENANEFFSIGKRRYGRHDMMDANDKNDTAVTRRVKNDYNTMTNKEFRSKYHGSKNTYRRRVNRYGDPYVHAKNSHKITRGIGNAMLKSSRGTKLKTTRPKTKLNAMDVAGLATLGGSAASLGAAAYARKKGNHEAAKSLNKAAAYLGASSVGFQAASHLSARKKKKRR